MWIISIIDNLHSLNSQSIFTNGFYSNEFMNGNKLTNGNSQRKIRISVLKL